MKIAQDRDLIEEPLSIEEISRLVEQAGSVERLLSKRSPKYPAYVPKVHDPSDWIPLMAEEPRLIKRPIVILGQNLLVGFDADLWKAALVD